jgi:phosphoribosylformylglycinamidine cyclo-ligase
MVVVVESDRVEGVTSALEDAGEQVHVLGRVTDGEGVLYEGSLG